MGAGIYFSTGLLLWVLVTLVFVVGGTVDHVACRTLKDPESSQLYELANMVGLKPALRQVLPPHTSTMWPHDLGKSLGSN